MVSTRRLKFGKGSRSRKMLLLSYNSSARFGFLASYSRPPCHQHGRCFRVSDTSGTRLRCPWVCSFVLSCVVGWFTFVSRPMDSSPSLCLAHQQVKNSSSIISLITYHVNMIVGDSTAAAHQQCNSLCIRCIWHMAWLLEGRCWSNVRA